MQRWQVTVWEAINPKPIAILSGLSPGDLGLELDLMWVVTAKLFLNLLDLQIIWYPAVMLCDSRLLVPCFKHLSAVSSLWLPCDSVVFSVVCLSSHSCGLCLPQLLSWNK